MSLPTPIPQPVKDDRLSLLIALKRLERPDAAFWEDFEHEFRAKQLARLVRVDPWYIRQTKKVLSFARKAYLPAAATLSAIAMALAGVTYYSQLTATAEQTSSTTLAEVKNTEAKPLFIVQADKELSTPVLRRQQLQTVSVSQPTTYKVSIMANPRQTTSYRLIYSPVALTPDQSQQSNSTIGAKVITADREF